MEVEHHDVESAAGDLGRGLTGFALQPDRDFGVGFDVLQPL